VDTVGAHIGDEADGVALDVDAFVETLRDAHGMGRREAELAACLLLEGRGGKRRRRIALGRSCFNRGDRKCSAFEGPLESLRLCPRPDIQSLNLLPIGTDEAPLKGLAR